MVCHTQKGKINIKMTIAISEVILFLFCNFDCILLYTEKIHKAPFIKLLNFWIQSVMFAVILVVTYYAINKIF